MVMSTPRRLWTSGAPPAMRTVAAWLVLLAGVLGPAPARAQRAIPPADAMVFIRIIGDRRGVYGDVRRETVEQQNIEVATGSGFLISPLGYVITNDHVISNRTFVRVVRGVPVEYTVSVNRIEVIFPAGLADTPGLDVAPRFEASVYATDPDLDLALLFISGAEFPYVAFGDSDAIEPGEPITALWFPFGQMVEVARGGVPNVVPRVNTSRGEVSALRADVNGDARYIQTNATLNPGNSGGPLLDRNDFVVAVVRMVLTRGQDIGFGVPINHVKEFLRAHGVDQMLPTRGLVLRPFQTFDGKGVGLPMPDGFEDRAPTRTRVNASGGQSRVALRVDRVVSPLSVEQLERELLTSRTLERFSAPSVVRHRSPDPRLVSGFAVGRDPSTRQELALQYAIVDLGRERLIARYLGPAEAIAFNRSVFARSLDRLDSAPLLTAEVSAPEWRPTPLSDARAPQVTLPAGWATEVSGPAACAGVPPPDGAISASPLGDFSVSFRAGWWSALALTAQRAADTCGAERGGYGAASYATGSEWLGVSYTVEGIFIDLGDNGLLQVEIVAPDRSFGYVRGLLDGWAEGAIR